MLFCRLPGEAPLRTARPQFSNNPHAASLSLRSYVSLLGVNRWPFLRRSPLRLLQSRPTSSLISFLQFSHKLLFHFLGKSRGQENPVTRRRKTTMQASQEISICPPEVDAPQGNLDRTPLLNSELEEVLETPALAPVRLASNLSPSVSAPVSASTPNMGLVQILESRFLYAERLEIIRVMEDFVMLVVISSFFYFFVVELSMVDDMRAGKLLVALACAVILGVLSSTLALLLAMRYMWIYVAVEFALVAVFFFTFHFLLHLKPLWVTLMGSSILAFAISISLNSSYFQHLSWRVQVSENSSRV